MVTDLYCMKRANAVVFFRYYRRWALARTVRIPHGVRTDQLGCYPFLLEQQLRAQASLANLLFCVGVRVGSPRVSPRSLYVFIVYPPVRSLYW